MRVAIDQVLETIHRIKADVCWFMVGSPPKFWIARTERVLDVEPLTETDIEQLIVELVSEDGRKQLHEEGHHRHTSKYGEVMRFGVHVASAVGGHVVALRRLAEVKT